MSRTRNKGGSGGAADWNTLLNKPANLTEFASVVGQANDYLRYIGGQWDGIQPDILEFLYNQLFSVDLTYPSAGEFNGTVWDVGSEAEFNAAVAAASDGDTILLGGPFVASNTLTVNKRLKIDGPYTIRTAGLGTDPVTLMNITANGVYITDQVSIKHIKSTNTSLETAINVTAEDFICDAYVEFVEFGIILRGSFNIGGQVKYVGPTGNTNRAIAIYKLSGNSQIKDTLWDFTNDATPRANFIFISTAVIGDLFDYNLKVKNCFQTDMTKIGRQFLFFEVLAKTGGATPSVIFENNKFNCLNGDVGMTFAEGQDLSFWNFLAIMNNYSGPAAYNAGSYKGLCFCDGTGSVRSIGNTQLFVAGNRNYPLVRSGNDYTMALPNSSLCYRNTLFTNGTPVSRIENLQLDQAIYNYIRALENKLDVTMIREFADNAAAIAGGLIVGSPYRTGDALKIVHS